MTNMYREGGRRSDMGYVWTCKEDKDETEAGQTDEVGGHREREEAQAQATGGRGEVGDRSEQPNVAVIAGVRCMPQPERRMPPLESASEDDDDEWN